MLKLGAIWKKKKKNKNKKNKKKKRYDLSHNSQSQRMTQQQDQLRDKVIICTRILRAVVAAFTVLLHYLLL